MHFAVLSTVIFSRSAVVNTVTHKNNPLVALEPQCGMVYRTADSWFLTDSRGITHGPYPHSNVPIAALLASEISGFIELPQPGIT